MNTKRKLLFTATLILLISYLSCLFTAVHANDTEINTVSVSPTSISQNGGAVMINLSGAEGVCGGSFYVVFDGDLLQFDYYSPLNGVTGVANLQSDGRVKVSFASAEALTDGYFFLIGFRALGVGSASVTVSDLVLYDGNGEALPTVHTKGAECVTYFEVNSYSLSKTEVDLTVGQSETVSLLLQPQEATLTQEVTWYSQNEQIAAVDENGKITARAVGDTVIYCRIGDHEYLTCWVHITEQAVLRVTKPVAMAGGEVAVKVLFGNSSKALGAGSFNLVYDSTLLKLTGTQKGTMLNSCSSTVNETYGEDTVRVNFASSVPLVASGEVLELRFEVLGENGQAAVRIENAVMYDPQNQKVEYATEDGGVKIIKDSTLYLVADSNAQPATQTGVSMDPYKAFDVTVEMNLEFDLSSGSFDFVYDPTVFTLVKAVAGSALEGAMATVNTSEAGRVRLSFASVAGISGVGELLCVTLQPKTATFAAALNIENSLLYDADVSLASALTEGLTVVNGVHQHTYSSVVTDPTCTDEGYTTHTCAACGAVTTDSELRPLGHDLSVVKHDAAYHWNKCSRCDATDEKIAHSGGTATCTEAKRCTACGNFYGKALGHDLTVAEHDATHHWNKCSRCDATDEKTEHSGGEAECGEQMICAACATPYGDPLAHDLTVTKHDATHHWNKCSRCEVTGEKTEHSGGKATCTGQKVCTDCGAPYGDPLGHDFTVAEHDATHHWNKCSRCKEIDGKTEHSGETVCGEQTVCTACAAPYGEVVGHDLTVIQQDATHHWHKCSRCDATDEKTEHSGGTPICGEQKLCADCAAPYGEAVGHDLTVIQQDATHHWHKCSRCDVTDEKENHAYDAWSDWADNGNGTQSKHAACTCGKKLSVTVPKTDDAAAAPNNSLLQESIERGTDLSVNVEENEGKIDEEEKEEILLQIADSQAIFLDITISDLQKNNFITDTKYVLEVTVRLDLSNKTNLGVWRNHNGTVEAFERLNTRPTDEFADGTYYADAENDVIYLYTNRFSTYAVTYEEVAVLPPDGNGGEDDGNGGEDDGNRGDGNGTDGSTTAPGSDPAPDDEPSETPKQKAPIGVIVAIVIAVLVVLGGGGFTVYWFVLRDPTDPEERPAVVGTPTPTETPTQTPTETPTATELPNAPTVSPEIQAPVPSAEEPTPQIAAERETPSAPPLAWMVDIHTIDVGTSVQPSPSQSLAEESVAEEPSNSEPLENSQSTEMQAPTAPDQQSDR